MYFASYLKINSKWIINLNVKCETIKLLKTTGGNFCDFGLGKDFLDTITKAYYIKEKIDKLDFIKIENIWSSNTLLMKRQATDTEKIFATHISDKKKKLHTECIKEVFETD